MTIRIDIERRTLQLTTHLAVIATMSSARPNLQRQFLKEAAPYLTAYTPLAPEVIHPNILKWMITRASEQVVYRPLEELHHFYFTYTNGYWLLPGYPRLLYNRPQKKALCASTSAIGAIGEGVSALLAQRLYQGTRRLARPLHDFPDLVTTDTKTTFMVEAKATTGSVSQIKQVIEDELFRMAQHVGACTPLDIRPVVGLLIGTALLEETRYHSVITEVRL
jgi:hypothetical protein